MQIIFHAHRAVVSENMRLRAERLVRKLAARARRPVDAIVRFEQDGPERRVEIVLHAPRRRSVIAAGAARTFGPALAEAAERVGAQLKRVKRTPKARGRTLERA